MVTTREDHDQSIKQLSPEAAKVIESSVAFKNIGGQDLVFLWHTDDDEGISVHGWDHVDQEVITPGYIDYYELEDEETEGTDEVYCTYTGYFSDYTSKLENAVTSRS